MSIFSFLVCSGYQILVKEKSQKNSIKKQIILFIKHVILHYTLHVTYVNISLAESIFISNSHFIASISNIPGLLHSRHYIFLIQAQHAKHF